MNWAETIVQSLKNWDTSLIAYVPDISIDQVTSRINDDPFSTWYRAAGKRRPSASPSEPTPRAVTPAVFMQSSGFGNSVNAVASLCIPARAPIPFFINLRGGPGEFNISQVPMGRTTRPILDQLGLSTSPWRRVPDGQHR